MTISRPLRVLVVIFAAAFAVCLAAAGVMETRWFHDVLKRRLVTGLEELTGAQVELGELKIRPLIFQIELRALTLHGTEPASQPPLLRARTLVVRMNPASLLEGRLTLSRFVADGLQIHFQTYANGATNLPGPHQQSVSVVDELMNLEVGTAVLEHADLFWNDHRIPLDTSAKDVSAILNYSPQRGYWGGFSSSALRFKIRGALLPALALSTQMEFSRSGLALNRLAWRSEGVSGGGVVRLLWLPELHGEADLEANGQVDPLARLLKLTILRGGAFQLHARVVDEAGRLSASGEAEVRQASVRSVAFASGPVDLTSNFAADSTGLRMDRLRIAAMGGVFTGAGSVHFGKPKPHFALSGNLQNAPLSRLLRTASRGQRLDRLLPYDSEVSGKFQAQWLGVLEALRADFDLQFAPPSNLAPGLRPLSGFAKGSLADSGALSVKLGQVQLQTLHSSFTAQGALGASEPGLRVQYRTTDFEESRPLAEFLFQIKHHVPVALNSAATFTGAFEGTVAHPKIQGRLAIGAFSYRGWTWGGFDAKIRAASNSLQVASGQLRSGPSVFRFHGTAALVNWNLTADSFLQLDARAIRTPIEGLQDAFGLHYPVAGLISGELQLMGTTSKLTGAGGLQVTNGDLDGEPFDRLSAKAVITGSVWEVQQIILTKGSGRLTGWGRLDLPNRTFSAELDGVGFSLAQFERPAPHLQGSAAFRVEGRGTFSAPRMSSVLEVRKFGFDGSNLGDFKARFTLDGAELQSQASLQGPEGALHFHSSARLQGDWPSEFSGSFTALRLDPWMHSLGPMPLQAPVTATGSFRGSGPLKTPSQLTLQAEARTLNIAVPGFGLKNTEPVELHYAQRLFATNQFVMIGPASTKIQVRLAAGTNATGPVSLDLQGDTRASVLQLLDPSVRAAGRLTLNFHARGSPNHPALSGTVGIHDVSLRFAGLPVPVAGLNGAITLQGDRAQIGPLTAVSGESSIRLTGYVTLGPVLRYNLRAGLDHVRLEYPADFVSLLSGNLRLSGAVQSGEMTGDVTIEQMFVSQNFNLVNWLGRMGSAAAAEPALAGPSSSSAPNVRLNIHVLTTPEVRVSSSTLSFDAAINTTLRGTMANPVAVGNIHIRNGQALIAGNRYQIERGDITMTSPVETTPILDIEAQTRVQGYDLT
ncbi:MAG TPA: translocation/assembly module TamB domain-containing protein, partial [Terriglobia bacterium]|nr:translocation/assembly module TamB domain-containing protein [Terriglobia bacterium]